MLKLVVFIQNKLMNATKFWLKTHLTKEYTVTVCETELSVQVNWNKCLNTL